MDEKSEETRSPRVRPPKTRPRRWRPAEVKMNGSTYFLHPDGRVYLKGASLKRIKEKALIQAVKQRFIGQIKEEEQATAKLMEKIRRINQAPG